jgi:hypothetical protein
LDTQTVPIAAKVLTPSPLLTPQLWCKCRWHVDAIYMSPGHVNVAVFCDMKALGAVLALKICAQIVLFTHFLGWSTFPGKFSHISFVFTQIVIGVIWVP